MKRIVLTTGIACLGLAACSTTVRQQGTLAEENVVDLMLMVVCS